MTSKKKIAARIIFWILSIAIMAGIFFFSSQPAEESNDVSDSLTERVLSILFEEFDFLPDDAQTERVESLRFAVRKSAHFSIYAALGITLFAAVYTYGIRLWKKYMISLPIALIYAVSDEVHQRFVPGRSGEIQDVLIDFSGSLCGVIIISLVILIVKKISSGRKKKMRKKELMQRLSELVAANERMNATVKSLKAENEELKKRIKQLEEEAPEEKAEPVIENEKTEGFTVKVIDEIDFDNIDIETDPASEPVLLDDMLEYGAAVIGKITVESAKYCDIITAKTPDNLKELLGLIMGKSEVCKNDILGIALSDAAVPAKRDAIDKQQTEAIDYFKSIAEQIA